MTEVFWDEIEEIEYLNPEDLDEEDREYVYDFSVEDVETFATSDGLIVHNTLNSTDYNEKIIVRKNKKNIFIVKIGDFIEKINKTYEKKYKEYIEKGDQTFIHVNKQNENYDIYAIDWDGNYKWCELYGVTKHLPLVNGKRDNLVKITLESGRTAIGTKAKSFLRYNKNNKKIEYCGGNDIKLNDYVPIVKKIKIPFEEQLNYLDLEEYFPKDKYIYGNEIIKTLKWKNNDIYKSEYNQKRHWYTRFNGNKFTLPYSRSDCFIDGLKLRLINSEMPKENFIYSKKSTSCNYPLKLPEKFELDNLFGFFIGAYLAEGLANKNQVKISNNDKDFRNKIYDFCDKYEIGYYTTKKENIKGYNKSKVYTFRNRKECIKDKTTTYAEFNRTTTTTNKNNGISTDIVIYNTMLSDLLKKLCNTGSKNKKVPDFCYSANNDFIKGLLDGYLSGDGTLNKTTFSYTTVSEDLGKGIALLLKRFDIHTKIYISKDKRYEKNNYYIITLKNYKNFKYLTLTIKYKLIKMFKMINKNEKPMKIFRNNILEKVIKKEEIESSHKYVYDLSIKENPNFLLFNGIPEKNTFHYSGVASKSNVNSGVPRIRELISVTKKPATPSLTVYLNNNYKSKSEEAKKVLNILEKVSFVYFIEESSIYYDPDVLNSKNEEDKVFYQDYYNFNKDVELNTLSPWVLKLKINELYFLNKNITMFDLYTFLLNKYGTTIHIIYSDENSSQLCLYFRYKYDDINRIVDDELVTNEDIKNLKILENEILSKLLNGIENIEKVTMREINELKIKNDGSIDNTKKEIILDTTGTNLYDILSMYNYLNLNKTFSNDIHEVYNILGIEAARQLLKNEINNVMKFSGIYINDKHLNLLVDFMTLKGELISIDRHGVRISDSGPLAKSSFEESDEHFIKSSIFNVNDSMKSLTSNLIMGQVGKFGTGICDIEFDMKELKKIKNKIY